MAQGAERYLPGHGALDLGMGFDTEIGALGHLRLLHRFDERWYGGIEGQLAYPLLGPRRRRWSGSILGVFGGRW